MPNKEQIPGHFKVQIWSKLSISNANGNKRKLNSTVIGNSQGNPIASWIPDDITLDVTADWDSPLLSAGTSPGTLGIIQQAVGLSFKGEWNSIAVWLGSSPIQMSLPLQFIAEREGEAESQVLAPIKQLMKLASPTKLSGRSSYNPIDYLHAPPNTCLFIHI